MSLRNAQRGEINIYYYNLYDVIIAMLLFWACMLYRPMFLGNKYSNIGMALFLLLIILSIVKQKGKLFLRKDSHYRSYLSAIFLFAYCFFQCVLTNSDRMIAGLQTVILLSIAVTAFFLVLANKCVQVLLIKILFFVMILFAVSYIVSIIFMLSVGWETILITSFDYGYYRNTDIYFPFSTTYGSMPFMGIIFRRLLGFARESGLMQIFYVWGFFSAERYFSKYRIIQIIMLIGLLGCFSSAGFIVFGVSLFLYFDVRDLLKKNGLIKVLILCLLCLAVIYILFYAQGTSLSTRAEATIDDRMAGIYFGLEVFKENPIFGGGFYSTFGNANIQTGVCALASLGQIGLLGFILWLSVFWYAYKDCPDKKRYIYTNAALFITALFSQPIMFAPVMYIFLFFDYDSCQISMIRRKKSISFRGDYV